MTLHREGYKSIAIATLLFGALNLSLFWFFGASLLWLCELVFIISLAFLLLIVSFFRIPNRKLTINENQVIAPADGKVVVIEETVDPEYFKDKRLQVSIFMSPLNVHVNRNPLSGDVVYNQYHKGKFLVAWHPKSSTENLVGLDSNAAPATKSPNNTATPPMRAVGVAWDHARSIRA